MKIRLTEEIWKEGNMYVSYCPELDIASCGEDVQHPGAIRPVITPKYKEVPIFVIRNNMRIIGLSREKYFELLQKA